MKPFGSAVNFTRERNADIMRVFRKLIADIKVISMPAICRQIADSPASRFWVSPERAAIVISSMLSGRDISGMTPTKREMFEEIFRRYQILSKRNPEKTIIELASFIVHQPAPKFYLTPRTIEEFIYRIKNGYYNKTTVPRTK